MAERKRASTRTKRKTGPPRRTDWQDTFLEEVEKNVVIGLACKVAGVDRSTFTRERQRNEDFALRYEDAHNRGLDTLEAVLRVRATRGQPYRKTVTKKNGAGEVIEIIETQGLLIDTTAAIFLLKRYRPEFRDTFRVENTGPDGGPIVVENRIAGAKEELFAELDRIRSDD